MLRACDDPRLLAGLRHSCGPVFMDALENPEVIEIMLNPDGTLWIEKYGQDHECVGTLKLAQSRLILSQVASGLNRQVKAACHLRENQVASGLNLTVNEKNPIAGTIPRRCIVPRNAEPCMPSTVKVLKNARPV